MGSEAAPQQLRIFFKLFASHGVASTIVTAPSNTALVTTSIHRANYHSLSLLQPTQASPTAGMPPLRSANSTSKASTTPSPFLRGPFHHLLADHQPNCLIADMFLPWTTDIAYDMGFPRLIFHGMC